MSEEWWKSQRNLGAVADYMAMVRGDNGRTVAEVMSKPWNWPEIWTEFQAALEADIEIIHVQQRDGTCKISLNGQGHLPCSEHA